MTKTPGHDPLDEQAVDLDVLQDASEAQASEAEPEVHPLEKEIHALKDQLLRAVAETENLRKRNIREKEDALKYAVTGFARDLLAVSDNLRRALESAAQEETLNDNLQAMVEGVEMTEKQLLAAFKQHGIAKIAPQKGEKFSYDHHQAMVEIPDADAEAGTVAQLIQPGYQLHDRLLRPAMVSVAKRP